jgi:hypothetical protein
MKGILIIFMLYHHLFSGDYTAHNVQLVFAPDIFDYPYFVLFGKTCVGGFAFLSAYGIMKQMMKINKPSGFIRAVLRRLIRLESTVIFIYTTAMLYITLVMKVKISTFYLDANGYFHRHWILIDALGLADLFRTPTFNVTWWYMSAAVLIILVMPFVCLIYRKLRYYTLPVMAVYPYLLMRQDRYANHLAVLLAAVFFGSAFAYENWFEKIDDLRRKAVWSQIVYIAVCAALTVFAFCGSMKHISVDRYYVPAAVVMASLTMSYFSRIPYLNKVLGFLGKYSGDIFMVHTLIYFYYYPDFIYSFRYDLLILAVLLAISLLAALIISGLKKLTRYDRLTELVLRKLEAGQESGK